MSSSISIDPQASLARMLKGEYPDARGRFGLPRVDRLNGTLGDGSQHDEHE